MVIKAIHYVHIWHVYLTIIPQVRVGYEMAISNHLISNKLEWNNCFIKNAHKIWRILPEFICKNNQFSACFNFEQTGTVTIVGEHGIMLIYHDG